MTNTFFTIRKYSFYVRYLNTLEGFDDAAWRVERERVWVFDVRVGRDYLGCCLIQLFREFHSKTVSASRADS